MGCLIGNPEGRKFCDTFPLNQSKHIKAVSPCLTDKGLFAANPIQEII
jgi:hypothetical protein